MLAGKLFIIIGLTLILLLGGGCSGVLFEKQHEDGRVSRLKIDGGEGWSEYDDKPRYPQSKTKDEYYIVIKKEATF
jgi:hypothetical protein